MNVGAGGGAAAAPAAGGAAPAGGAAAEEAPKEEEKEEGEYKSLDMCQSGEGILTSAQRRKSPTKTWASVYSIKRLTKLLGASKLVVVVCVTQCFRLYCQPSQ